jgi:hypothetical protein
VTLLGPGCLRVGLAVAGKRREAPRQAEFVGR